MKKQVSEGSLHKWFKGSKSKDGKGGWVNVVTGGTCASDEPGEGTPKCVSSSKRASMSKSERLSAARRKKKADPGQQQKSGAAKPTYVSTDKKKKKMKESYTRALTPLSEKAQKCWKGYEKKGTKKMFGKTYNNCVKKEEVELVDEAKYEKGASDYGKTSIRNKRAFGKGGNAADPKERGGAKMLRHDSHTKRRGVKKNNKYGATNKPPVDGAPSDEFKKDRYATKESYSANPKQQAAIAVSKKDRLEKMLVAKKKKKENVYSEEIIDENQTAIDLINKSQKVFDNLTTNKETGKKNLGGKIIDAVFGNKGGKNTITKPEYQNQIQKNSYEPESETIEEGDKKGKGSGSKDACYHKVKSRYSVWPSAYASGALVKCRKVGAANWGNSSKKEDFSDWKAEFIWEDGDSAKKIEEASSPAWQRKEGKSESGGLNKKGVASYRAANPGSKLKTAVTTKPSKLKRGSKSAKRRKSFCSRMKGMKKKLTSAKTARDPDSRINKALRKWNC